MSIFQLTHVGVFGGGEAAVGTLRAPQAELQQSDVLPGRHPVPGRVGRHQTGRAGSGQVRSGRHPVPGRVGRHQTGRSGQVRPGVIR